MSQAPSNIAPFNYANTLNQADPALWGMIEQEVVRQHEHIELIASENYTSPAVMQAQGSQLTNKYAEGYPGKRFYGGCEFVDQVEQLAIDRLKALYGAEYANVQPHSGSQANQAVYFSILKPGDTVMGMNLGHGGHLTHGSPANLSGKLFNIVPYGLNDKEEIDYDEMERIAVECKPKLLIGGASAYALRFDWARMAEIAKKVGAYFMVDMAHYSGLIAAGVYPNPAQVLKNAQVMAETLTARGLRIISGRTESHMFLVDLRPKGLTGKAADAALGLAHITVNKNSIPNDPESPFVTSGIRIGAPAITTRGFKEEEAKLVANLIADVLDNPADEAVIAATKAKVHALTARFPVYQG